MFSEDPYNQKIIEEEKQISKAKQSLEQNMNFRQIISFVLPSNQASSIQIVYNINGIRNLRVTRQFYTNQIIFQVPYSQTPHQDQFIRSKLAQYIHWLNSNLNRMPPWRILGEYQSDIYIKELVSKDSTYNLMPQIYLFQYKFMSKYKNSQNSLPTENKWFEEYVRCLPNDFSQMPYRYINIIQHYHEELANSLKEFCESLHKAFQLLKDLIYGKNIQYQWSFQEYLRTVQEDYEYYYQKYCQQFTFDNFEWAFFSWKTRAFDRIINEGAVTTFLPIFDMINHSLIQQNAEWFFDQAEQRVILKAIQDINAGKELFIYYGERSLQASFEMYGFMSQQQKCLIKIERASQKSVQIAQLLLNQEEPIEQLARSLKDQLQAHFSLRELAAKSIYESRLREQVSSRQQIKYQMLKKMQFDLPNFKYTHQERQIITKVRYILQKELRTLSKMSKAFDLIFL